MLRTYHAWRARHNNIRDRETGSRLACCALARGWRIILDWRRERGWPSFETHSKELLVSRVMTDVQDYHGLCFITRYSRVELCSSEDLWRKLSICGSILWWLRCWTWSGITLNVVGVLGSCLRWQPCWRCAAALVIFIEDSTPFSGGWFATVFPPHPR